MKRYLTQSGHSFPFRAIFESQGPKFSVRGCFSTRLEMLIHEQPDNPAPFQFIKLDTELNNTVARMFIGRVLPPIPSMAGA